MWVCVVCVYDVFICISFLLALRNGAANIHTHTQPLSTASAAASRTRLSEKAGLNDCVTFEHNFFSSFFCPFVHCSVIAENAMASHCHCCWCRFACRFIFFPLCVRQSSLMYCWSGLPENYEPRAMVKHRMMRMLFFFRSNHPFSNFFGCIYLFLNCGDVA